MPLNVEKKLTPFACGVVISIDSWTDEKLPSCFISVWLKDLIFVNGKEKRVPQRVFNLLYYFIENKNKVVERGSLLRDVWGTDIVVSHRTIDVHVCKIRNLDIPFIKTLKHAYIWQE